MKNIFRIILLILVSGSFAACSSDYLETEPTDSMSPSSLFATTENAKLAINGINVLFTSQRLSSQGFNGEGTIKMYAGNYPGNNFTVNLTGWASIINQEYHTNTSTVYNYYMWYHYYMVIGNANQVVENIDGVEGADTEKAFIKAQALTYRAYSYMMLAQLYCYRWVDSNNGATDGLVLRIDTSTGSMPLSTLAETYEQIYADLGQAISLYDESGLDRDANYDMNIDCAYAIYARAAINRNDYSTAKTYAVKARAGYPLMDNDDYASGFCEPNDEWIWSSYGSADETLYYYSFQAYIAYNSNASAVRLYPKCISKELFDEIPEGDVRRTLFLDPLDYGYSTTNGLASSSAYPDLYNYAMSSYPDIYSTSYIYAYMNLKFKCTSTPGVGHLNHIRSSEMYLIEAEANYFLNDEASAKSALVALNATSGRNPGYTCSLSGADLLDEIKFYYQVELWGEGFDWFLMKRWNDSIERKSYANGGSFVSSLDVTIAPDEKNKWTWLIPNKETDYNFDL